MRWVVRRPWVAAGGFALMPLLFVLPASVAVVVMDLDTVPGRLLTTTAVALSLVVALLIMRRSPLPLAEFGWRRPTRVREALWFLPLAAAVAGALTILLVDGTDVTPTGIVLGAVLAVVVGFCEEAWYRGLVLQVLRPLGDPAAVLGSAALFSVVHAAGMLGGAELLPTLLQLGFALIFGLVTALLLIRTGSLFPGVVWHGLHNSISFASADHPTMTFVIGYALVGGTLIAFAVWLWTRPEVRPPRRVGP